MEIFRLNSDFFLLLGPIIVNFWIDIEENENVEKARELLNKIEEKDGKNK